MAWSIVLDFLKAIWPSVVSALRLVAAGWAGKALSDGSVAKEELRRIQHAQDRVASNLQRPVDERLRDADQRGLYRVSDEPSDD